MRPRPPSSYPCPIVRLRAAGSTEGRVARAIHRASRSRSSAADAYSAARAAARSSVLRAVIVRSSKRTRSSVKAARRSALPCKSPPASPIDRTTRNPPPNRTGCPRAPSTLNHVHVSRDGRKCTNTCTSHSHAGWVRGARRGGVGTRPAWARRPILWSLGGCRLLRRRGQPRLRLVLLDPRLARITRGLPLPSRRRRAHRRQRPLASRLRERALHHASFRFALRATPSRARRALRAGAGRRRSSLRSTAYARGTRMTSPHARHSERRSGFLRTCQPPRSLHEGRSAGIPVR